MSYDASKRHDLITNSSSKTVEQFDSIYKYVNINIDSRDIKSPNVTKDISTSLNLDSSILQHPHTYRVAISRAEISMSDVPILIAPFKDISTLKTAWTIALSTNGVRVTRDITFIPRVDLNDTTLKYYEKYGFYSIMHFIEMVNSAYLTVFQELKADPLANVPLDAEPPQLFYDNNTNHFTWKLQKAYYDRFIIAPFPVTDAIYVEWDTALDTLIPYFDVIYQPGFGVENQLYVHNTLSYNQIPIGIPADVTNADYYWITQPTNNGLTNWNPVQRIFIETNLPIRNQLLPQEKSSGLNQRNLIDILTNQVQSSDRFFNRNKVEVTNSVYDYHNLEGASPITSISIRVLWTDNFGNEYVMQQTQNAQTNITLLFESAHRD